jgi:TonB family protein
MKGGVGSVTCCCFIAPDPSGVGQIFGKCPALLPEAMTFSAKPSILTLCPFCRVWHFRGEGGVMRWLVSAVLLFVLSVESRAGDVFLIPENNPKPIYPLALQRAGIIGEVRVGFTVHADGSVSKVSILKSDHPDLAEATRVAIDQWRFKPWTLAVGRPAKQEVTAPMVFRIDFDLPIDSNQWLKELRCRDLNEALVHVAEHKWIDSYVFHYTRAYLSNALSTAMLPNERRLALIAKMNRKVPIIVRECLNSPVSRYVRFLPEDIRKLL